NEMISNSLKHAFKNRKEGKIKVHLRHLENKKYELIIGDDGVGKDKDFKAGKSSAFGTELIQIFTEQLEGTMERLNQPGTVFKIVFEKIDNL
ncbi:MAG: sensor histidine kinase, partial [Crocinitomicaceae bacterium]|nr:sensor histidine kinase [Crocinitomicaceae bacterium]